MLLPRTPRHLLCEEGRGLEPTGLGQAGPGRAEPAQEEQGTVPSPAGSGARVPLEPTDTVQCQLPWKTAWEGAQKAGARTLPRATAHPDTGYI